MTRTLSKEAIEARMSRVDESGLPMVVSFDAERCTRDLQEKGITYRTVGKYINRNEGSIRKAFLRSRMSYYMLDEIACLLGKHPLEYLM